MGGTASGVAARTHVDKRLFELDVEPVVGRCDDGIFRSPHVLCELPVQLGKGNLATAADKARQTDGGQRRPLMAPGMGTGALFNQPRLFYNIRAGKAVKHLLPSTEVHKRNEEKLVFSRHRQRRRRSGTESQLRCHVAPGR